MNTPPATFPSVVSRNPARKGPELAPALYCPHTDLDLDDAVAFDVADFDDLRLMSATTGESTRAFAFTFAADFT